MLLMLTIPFIVIAAIEAGETAVLLGVVALAGVISLALVRDWWRRAYIVTLIAMVAGTTSFEAVGSVGGYVKIAAVGILATVTLFTTRGPSQPIMGLHRLIIGTLWGTVALAFASTLWSQFPTESALQAAMFAAFAFILHRTSTVRWIDRKVMAGDIGAAYVVMLLVIVVGFVLAFAGMEGAITWTGRHQGLLNNPNLLGMLAALALTLGIGYAAHRRSPALWVSLLVPLAAIALSGSRTALLATAVAGLWVILRSGFVRTTLIALAAVTVALVMQASGADPFGSTLERFTANEGGDVLNKRSIVWDLVFHSLGTNPLGVGFGSTPDALDAVFSRGELEGGLSSVHNSYIQMLYELGWVAVVVVVILVAAFIKIAVSSPVSGLGVGLVATVVVGAVIQITESAIFGFGQPYPYLFWVAVLAAVVNSTQADKPAPVPRAKMRRRFAFSMRH